MAAGSAMYEEGECLQRSNVVCGQLFSCNKQIGSRDKTNTVGVYDEVYIYISLCVGKAVSDIRDVCFPKIQFLYSMNLSICRYI